MWGILFGRGRWFLQFHALVLAPQPPDLSMNQSGRHSWAVASVLGGASPASSAPGGPGLSSPEGGARLCPCLSSVWWQPLCTAPLTFNLRTQVIRVQGPGQAAFLLHTSLLGPGQPCLVTPHGQRSQRASRLPAEPEGRCLPRGGLAGSVPPRTAFGISRPLVPPCAPEAKK